MNNLPPEVLNQIVHHLSDADLFNLALAMPGIKFWIQQPVSQLQLQQPEWPSNLYPTILLQFPGDDPTHLPTIPGFNLTIYMSGLIFYWTTQTHLIKFRPKSMYPFEIEVQFNSTKVWNYLVELIGRDSNDLVPNFLFLCSSIKQGIIQLQNSVEISTNVKITYPTLPFEPIIRNKIILNHGEELSVATQKYYSLLPDKSQVPQIELLIVNPDEVNLFFER